MRLKPVIFFAAVGLLAAFAVYRQSLVPVEGVIGAPAPGFELEDRGGNTVRLEDFRGKVVFLNIWATWCEPCIREMPDMMELNQAFAGRPFQMLAVSVDTDFDAIEKFYREHDLDLPTLFDPGRRVYSSYRATGVPETFLIDGEGRIVQKYIGPREWTNPQFMAQIESLILEQETRAAPDRIDGQAGD